MENINRSYKAQLTAPFDGKVCNYYPDWSDYTIVIESIEEYLQRVIIDYRTPGLIITMLTPKTGYTSLGKYDYDSFGSILSHYDTKYYSFIDGIEDSNFVEAVTNDTQQITDYNEQISGVRNNVNNLFTLRYNYKLGSLRPYLNGLRMHPGLSYDYIEFPPNQIQFTFSLLSTDNLLIDYIKI